MKKILWLLLLLPALALAQVQPYPPTGLVPIAGGNVLGCPAGASCTPGALPNIALSALPPQFVACTNGSTGTVDTALLAAAAATGASINLTGNCTLNDTITLHANTIFNGNGYTMTAAAAANYSGGVIKAALRLADNATDVTVENTKFNWAGAPGTDHVLNFDGEEDGTSFQRISIINNTGISAPGDFVALVETKDVTVIGNKAYGCAGTCFDIWDTSGNIIETDNTASVPIGGVGFIYTGFKADNVTPSITINVNISHNIVYLTSATGTGTGIGIYIQGVQTACTFGTTLNAYNIVADNEIVMAAGVNERPIFVDWCNYYTDIHDNVITGDGATAQSAPAIEMTGIGGVQIHDNLVYGYLAPTTGGDAGDFYNKGINGSVINNKCFSCGALLVGLSGVPSSTIIYGNDNGSGVAQFVSGGSTAQFQGINTGTSSYNPTIGLFDANLTGGERSTLVFGQSATQGNAVQEEFSYSGNNNGNNFWAISMAGINTDFIKWIYFPDQLQLGDTGSIVDVQGAFQLNGVAYALGVRDDSTPAPAAVGSGYVVGDTITLNDGCSTHAVLTVNSVTTGAVEGYNVSNRGTCLQAPANPVAQGSTSGTGSGATFTLNWGNLSASVGLQSLAGANSTGGNLILGAQGPPNYGGNESVFLGTRAGGNAKTGNFNFIGGHDAAGIGSSCLNLYINAETVVGTDALRNTCGGDRATVIGSSAMTGYNKTGTSGNNFLEGTTCVGYQCMLNFNGAVGFPWDTAVGDNACRGVSGSAAYTNGTCIGTNSGIALTTATNFIELSGGGNGCVGGTNFASGSAVILIASCGQNVDTPAAGTSNYINIENILTVTGTNTPSTSVSTIAGTLAAGNRITSSGARAVNTGTTADTVAASKASTYESANTAAGAFTLTFAAPSVDGERRRVCFKNATGTITYAVTAPATATAGLPTTLTAGGCMEVIYNSVSGTPTNAPATSWLPY